MGKLVYEELTYKIIGIAMKVHGVMKPGLVEGAYEEAIMEELKDAKIPFESQKQIDLYYNDKKLKKKYRADLIIDDKILIELKAMKELSKTDEAQMINYLKLTKLKVGLLINFGGKSLEWKRVVN